VSWPKCILTLSLLLAGSASAQSPFIQDAYPEKARYAPREAIRVRVELRGSAEPGTVIGGNITDLGKKVGTCGPVLAARSLVLNCSAPSQDFRGYLVTVEARSAAGVVLDTRQTAIDVSSDWKRFPRYGYLAQYSHLEVKSAADWIAELNRFHINGLEFYDFQYRHEQPLAGSVRQPRPVWKDVAGREIDADVVRQFIEQAHAHNMMAMAYNASYSAYDDVFAKSKALPIEWATWPSANGPRTVKAAKTFNFNNPGWSTTKLFFMNQNEPAWQGYLFQQMHKLFEVYPFDGWHIDTFGEKSGFAFDGTPIDYVAGFKPYVDRASASLGKRIVLNTVNTWGQSATARSAADFVYSELWDDHETFASILGSAEQVHLANPDKAYVIAAYLHRRNHGDPEPASKNFNAASVLLTDATIFASGAAHIEMGDGLRMLSSEYFPADTRFNVTPELARQLRHYYDYLTAYEVYLRGDLTPAALQVSIEGRTVDSLGVPNTIWSICRQQGGRVMVHLINLLGSDDPHWRDIAVNRPAPPLLEGLRVRLTSAAPIHSIGWSSPDVDGGKFHALPITTKASERGYEVETTLPKLSYWDTLFLETGE
jgi:dextranase